MSWCSRCWYWLRRFTQVEAPEKGNRTATSQPSERVHNLRKGGCLANIMTRCGGAQGDCAAELRRGGMPHTSRSLSEALERATAGLRPLVQSQQSHLRADAHTTQTHKHTQTVSTPTRVNGHQPHTPARPIGKHKLPLAKACEAKHCWICDLLERLCNLLRRLLAASAVLSATCCAAPFAGSTAASAAVSAVCVAASNAASGKCVSNSCFAARATPPFRGRGTGTSSAPRALVT